MKIKELITESDMAPSLDREMQAKGYKDLGSGIDQTAYLEPETGMVLKIFGSMGGRGQYSDALTPSQKTFKVYADYCMANPNNPFLPQFEGWERFVWDERFYLQIRMERLFGFDNRQWGVVLEELARGARLGNEPWRKERFLNENITGEENPWNPGASEGLLSHLGMDGFNLLWDTITELQQIAIKHGWRLDLHDQNFMLGSDGEIVISDPFWSGQG